MVCINKNSLEYQSLKERAGISEFILESICRDFMDKYQRFPHLDELPNSNSEQSLRNTFNIKQNNSVKIQDILDKTGSETIEEAVININNQYRDLEVDILPIEEKALIDIKHRPSEYNLEEHDSNKSSSIIPNSYLIMNKALTKLADLYGIKFNEINDYELNSEKWRGVIPDASSVNAFVYNGQIYINTDRANIDAPIHEMFHILVGSMRFENPTLYQNLINTVETFKNYEALAANFPNRSRNDINEEIFVTETSKYFSGMFSELSDLNDKAEYELTYNLKRVLDSVLMGKDSVKTISDGRLYQMTLKELIEEVDSSLATNKFNGFINEEGSELHRELNNMKADLFKNGELVEICE